MKNISEVIKSSRLMVEVFNKRQQKNIAFRSIFVLELLYINAHADVITIYMRKAFNVQINNKEIHVNTEI